MIISFTKKEFLAWAKTKPANEQYSYLDNDNCPIAQFLKTKTTEKVLVGGSFFTVGEHQFQELPSFATTPAVSDSILSTNHNPSQTFGELVKLLS